MAIEVIRLLILASQRPPICRMTVSVAGEVADYLNNKKRHELVRLEDEGSMVVQVVPEEGVAPEYLLLDCRDAEGREVKFP
jgi:Ribonuclease G/E